MGKDVTQGNRGHEAGADGVVHEVHGVRLRMNGGTELGLSSQIPESDMLTTSMDRAKLVPLEVSIS